MEHETLHALPLKDILVEDSYWNRYAKLIPEVVLPYQWEILNDRVPDAPPSYCLQNFRIAAGEVKGTRKGTVFQDSDVAKWLEAVAYSLAGQPDQDLERTADEVIGLIGRAQCEDGYLDTYFQLVEPENRWKNLMEGHELYCAGHMIEAAVAYYSTTGKTALLEIVSRFADLIAKTFGPGQGQIHGYPGHPEIELALVRLYYVTREQKYADLAKYFVDERGKKPNYFLEEMRRPDFRPIFPELQDYDPAYSQSHLPVRLQSTAEGHAVRAVYLYSAMADLAYLYQDNSLLEACKALWSNIVNRRMFLTGGIGSSGFWERFTTDYDLPNESDYSETCASIGLAQFGLRMARITGDASYIDVVERALYNTVRAGISMQGDRYFYVNPLEVWPERCMEHTSMAHAKARRQKWFDVACCPTNVARTFTALGQYIYSAGEDVLCVNLFIQNRAKAKMVGGTVAVKMDTRFPVEGGATLQVNGNGQKFTLKIRVPNYAEGFHVLVNGKAADGEISGGYFSLSRVFGDDSIEVVFDIKAKFVFASPLVRANCGKVALLRGPEVYCLEETDNGDDLAAVYVDPETELCEEWCPDLLGGTVAVHFKGKKLTADNHSSVSTASPKAEDISLLATPYGTWGNREPGEMIVWMKQLIRP